MILRLPNIITPVLNIMILKPKYDRTKATKTERLVMKPCLIL